MIAHRNFASYEDYAYRQGGKSRTKREFLLAHLPKNTASFADIFTLAKDMLKPGPVLCLGARTGAESLGAERAGFTGSVGIDLHPVGPTVQQGDWHDLPFADASFPNVYCNSLDHCLDLDKLTAQVKRVLIKDGRFYVMATNRQSTVDRWKLKPGNEAMYWDTSNELRDLLYTHGFIANWTWHEGKWGHYVFRVAR